MKFNEVSWLNFYLLVKELKVTLFVSWLIKK
jgi:hypothetical protein